MFVFYCVLVFLPSAPSRCAVWRASAAVAGAAVTSFRLLKVELSRNLLLKSGRGTFLGISHKRQGSEMSFPPEK